MATRRPFFAPRSATRSGRLFFVASMAACLVCAGLEMAHVRGGILTSYGADVFGTAWFYATFRMCGTNIFRRGRPASMSVAAPLTFALGTASEIVQRAGLIQGTYDPFDILAFALAVMASVTLDYAFGPFVAVQRGVAAADVTS